MSVYAVEGLPDDEVAAAAAFHGEHLPAIRAALAVVPAGGHLLIAFAPAGHGHRGWRLAAVQSLARASAPVRVNAVVGDDEGARAAALAWLVHAPGITGQLFEVDGHAAAGGVA